MKKIMIVLLGMLSGVQYLTAQQNVEIKYPEEIYRYSDNGDLMGSARFKGLSGAMGALGGDLSATTVNPAGVAVFLNNEFNLTGGVNSSKIKTPNGSFKKSGFNLEQAGGVLVFSDLNSSGWKGINIGLNYQKIGFTKDNFGLSLNTVSRDSANLSMVGYGVNEEGEISVTNLNIGANYNDRIYIGVGLNVHSFEINRFGEHLFELDSKKGEVFDNYKDQSKWSRMGTGASISLGIIGKVNKELRLGLAYQSPTWFTDVEDSFVYFRDDKENYDRYNELNNKTTPQKLTASGAYVFGKSGFISADYIYTDYSTAKFARSDYSFGNSYNFGAENDFINYNLKSTSAIRVGGEARLDNIKLRAGYRYEQSPFEEVIVEGAKYIPFGDTNSLSLGAGYDFGGMYIDVAYSLTKRDRSTLISGNFYRRDNDGFVMFNAGNLGYGQVIDKITENKGSLAFTVGFRF